MARGSVCLLVVSLLVISCLAEPTLNSTNAGRPGPVSLGYSSYFGGSSFPTAVTGIALDAAGNIYLSGNGNVGASPAAGLPYTHLISPDGIRARMFVAKFDPTGANLIYLTVVQVGVHSIDSSAALAVDSAGNAVLAGTSDACQSDSAPFVLKIDSAGSALVYSRCLEGWRGDSAFAVTVDAAGAAYVTGVAANHFGLYNASGTTCANRCGFAAKVDASGSIAWGRFLTDGSSAATAGHAIALDSSGNSYVGGSGPVAATADALASSGAGFLVKLTTSGSVAYASQFPGQVSGVAVGRLGNVYLSGATNQAAFPAVGGFQTTINGGTDAFVAGLSPDLASIVYSTLLGGSGDETVNGMAVDAQGNVLIAGTTTSADLPVQDAIQMRLRSGSSCALRPSAPCSDAFLAKISTTGAGLIYSTYLGGTNDESTASLALNALDGGVWLAGNTWSSDFPTTRDAYQASPPNAVSNGFFARIDSGVSFVQSSSAQVLNAGAVMADFPSANNAGNLILAFVRMSGSAQNVVVTDSAGNVYVDAVSQAQTADDSQIRLFYAADVKGGANTVAAQFSAPAAHAWLVIYEYSGLAARNPLGQTAHAQGFGPMAESGVDAVGTSRPALVFAAIGLPVASALRVEAGEGFALIQGNAYSAGSAPGANEVVVAPGEASFSGSFQLSADANWSALVATFVARSRRPQLGLRFADLPGFAARPPMLY